MRRRRVITGQQPDGTSVFVKDETVDPTTVALAPGFEFHRIWAADTEVRLPTDGTEPSAPQYFPPVGGFRVTFTTIPPQSEQLADEIDIGAAVVEVEDKLPGFATVTEIDQPGMHTTDTVDVDFVVSGEVYLELDDGAEVHLVEGDCVVQNGTRHRWVNRSDEPATLFVALIGEPRD